MSCIALSNNQKNELLFVGFNQDYGEVLSRTMYMGTALLEGFCRGVQYFSTVAGALLHVFLKGGGGWRGAEDEKEVDLIVHTKFGVMGVKINTVVSIWRQRKNKNEL